MADAPKPPPAAAPKPPAAAKAPAAKGKMQVLREEQTTDFHVALLVDEAKCRAYLQFKQLTPGCAVKVAVLKTVLEAAGVVNGVQEGRLKEMTELILAGKLKASEEPLLVAEGKAPVQGVDGRVHFLTEPSPEDVHFEVRTEEAIDYKNTNLIRNVNAEQHLATVIPPKPNQDGLDVFGNRVPTSEGQPVKVRLGANVTMDGDKIFAAVNGRFILENDELSVNPVYLVRGDVDYTIGNVNFIGSVTIQKDVLDDFSVNAKEKVEVAGIVGAANVESSGDIIINGGANGKGRGFIRAQGRVVAKYLNEVSVVGREGVEAAKSIINCNLKTQGRIVVPAGTIIGGEIVARDGIEAGVIGSDMGILTSVTVGLDYEQQDRMKAYENQLAELTREIERIERIVGPLLADKKRLLSLSPEKKQALKGLLLQVKHFRSEQLRLREQLDTGLQDTGDTTGKDIKIMKMLYSGVRVTIGRCKRMIKMEIKGPIRLREDRENDTITITNLQA